MTSYQGVFENNKKWIEEKKRTNEDFFQKLSEGQSPDIGCSDSRVTAEDMMGVGPGEIFVHRNVANVVSTTDLNLMTVLEYAVAHLKVKHIVVCGHYFCGGVKAAMQPQDLGILNPWLSNIRDVYRLHKAELNAIVDENDRYNRLVELNVQEQCINVTKTAVVQQSYAQNELPKVHGWVFDIKSGKLIDLDLDINDMLTGIREIYDLGATA